MSKLTGAALDRAVANAMGLKSVNNCEQWGKEMTKYIEIEYELKVEDDDDIQDYKKPWVGLTEDERYKLWLTTPSETEDRFAFAKAIEQALKERNT
jgi:hypothetical protein